MKASIAYTVFLLLIISAGDVLAQDAGMSDVETVGERGTMEGEKVVFIPGETEVRYIPRASGVHAPSDSIALFIHDFPMQQAAQRPAEKANDKSSKQKDDSILTFNFLYYIIQKYKLQDIID